MSVKKQTFPRLQSKGATTSKISISSPFDVQHKPSLLSVDSMETILSNGKTSQHSKSSDTFSFEAAPATIPSSPIAASASSTTFRKSDEGSILVCICSFTAKASNELTIEEGEPLKMISKAPINDWIFVQSITKVGEPGWIPKDFVKRLDIVQPTKVSNTPPTPVTPKLTSNISGPFPIAKSKYNKDTSDYQPPKTMTSHGLLTPPTTPTMTFKNSNPMMQTSSKKPKFQYSSIKVVSAHNNNTRYWYKIILKKDLKSSDVHLCRYYQDFYELQIKLLQSTSGSSNQLPKLPSIISLKDTPGDQAMLKRCSELNDYLTKVISTVTSNNCENQLNILLDWFQFKSTDLNSVTANRSGSLEITKKSPLNLSSTSLPKRHSLASSIDSISSSGSRLTKENSDSAIKNDIFSSKKRPSFLTNRKSSSFSSSDSPTYSSSSSEVPSLRSSVGSSETSDESYSRGSIAMNGKSKLDTVLSLKTNLKDDDNPTEPLFSATTPSTPSLLKMTAASSPLNLSMFEKPTSYNQTRSNSFDEFPESPTSIKSDSGSSSLLSRSQNDGKVSITSKKSFLSRSATGDVSVASNLGYGLGIMETSSFTKFKIFYGDEIFMIRLLTSGLNLYSLKLSISYETNLLDEFSISYKDPRDGLYRPLRGSADLISCVESSFKYRSKGIQKVLLKII